jgi:hypothetical protein
MSATNDLDTLLCGQDLPCELTRSFNTIHAGDELQIASMLSGVVSARQNDDVICPLMLQRRLVVPSRYDLAAPHHAMLP